MKLKNKLEFQDVGENERIWQKIHNSEDNEFLLPISIEPEVLPGSDNEYKLTDYEYLSD